MLHRITGRAVKCGPAAISAITGVPTHAAAAVIRRLFDRPSVNGVYTDELAAALEEFGWAPDYALRHPKYHERRFARREEVWQRLFADVPFDVRAVTLETFLDAAPAGTWAISASNHFVAYRDGWPPVPWSGGGCRPGSAGACPIRSRSSCSATYRRYLGVKNAPGFTELAGKHR